METLELTIFDHGILQVKKLRELLDQFEKENRIKVHFETLPWDEAWAQMVQIAIYKDGPDISEMGSSWIGDFVHMDALRPFGANEIQAVGGRDAFLLPSWQSAGIWSGLPQPTLTLWGIPWLADVRVLAYRRDILQKAGIDPRAAFSNLDAIGNTLQQLKDAGVSMPLVLPTLRSRVALQVLTPWVWGEGGGFLSDDGREILFDSPAALRGFCRFFSLARYLSKDARLLDDFAAYDQFYDGKAAVTVGGHWLLIPPSISQDLLDKTGVVGMPPSSFVGGSHLVVWKHSRKAAAATKLVNFLAGSQTAPALYPGFGFPARFDAIENAEFAQDARNQIMVQAAIQGRTFPSGQLWGMVEKRLVDLLPIIWQEIFAHENVNIEKIVEKRLIALANRLRTTLQA